MKNSYEKNEWNHLVQKFKYAGMAMAILAICVIGIVSFSSFSNGGSAAKGQAHHLVINSISGDQMDLSQMKGKMIYIDFWASWCNSCREVNTSQNLVLESMDLSKAPVELVSISLDNSRIDWQQAVNEDQVGWKQHASDLNGWQSGAAKLFNVNVLPANYLIDERGRIIAKNITNEQLKAVLSGEAI